MVNEYLTRAYDTKVIFRELLCFYAPFGWVPVKENRAPSPNAPIHKMYDGNTVWSMEKQDYVSDYDVGRKRSEKIVIKRSTKYARNNRLMTEEAVMEYHLRFRYWLYPRCNRLRLINRCRPGWGSLWAIFFLIFAFLTAVVIGGAPTIAGNDVEYKDATISCQAEEGTVYSVSQAGPYFLIDNDNILFSENANGLFTDILENDKDKYGISYNKDTKILSFSKNDKGKDFGKAEEIIIYEGNTTIGNDEKLTSEIERINKSISVDVSEKAVYSLSEAGPYYAVKDGVLYYSVMASGSFVALSEEQATDLGVSYTNGRLCFIKDTEKHGLLSSKEYDVYKVVFSKGEENQNMIDASEDGIISLVVEDGMVYSLNEGGSFFKVTPDGILVSTDADNVYQQLGEEQAAEIGISYLAEDGKLSFSKDSNGNLLVPHQSYPIYNTQVSTGTAKKVTSGVTNQEASCVIQISDGYAYHLKDGRYYALKEGKLSYCNTADGIYVNDPSETRRDGVSYSDNKLTFKLDNEKKEFVLENDYSFFKTELYDLSLDSTDSEAVRYGIITVEVKNNTLYSVNPKGPFYKVIGESIKISGKDKDGKYDAYGEYDILSDEIAETYGLSYSPEDKKISFWKTSDGSKFLFDVDTQNKPAVYKTPDNFLGISYKKAFVETIEDWFAEKNLGKLFDILCYVFAGLNALLLLYQLQSNWWLKKNTERIIGCCINAKAIVQAMQYEDITLMNGRQRHRYYQGQVINEAMRNTGDPQYFGS